jgi:hypothetical protein
VSVLVDVAPKYTDGFRRGYSDGYRAAMEEIMSKQRGQMNRAQSLAQDDMKEPGVNPENQMRWWFWPW